MKMFWVIITQVQNVSESINLVLYTSHVTSSYQYTWATEWDLSQQNQALRNKKQEKVQ